MSSYKALVPRFYVRLGGDRGNGLVPTHNFPHKYHIHSAEISCRRKERNSLPGDQEGKADMAFKSDLTSNARLNHHVTRDQIPSLVSIHMPTSFHIPFLDTTSSILIRNFCLVEAEFNMCNSPANVHSCPGLISEQRQRPHSRGITCDLQPTTYGMTYI